jgi:2-polyprenyl-6-methoxyphenol hydroxylase-like FAD-dependent oxidoreductase
MKNVDTTVLIVGAGPVGLTLSLVFAKFGVDCLVVERNVSTTQHPKMDITNGRSMEIFQSLGIAEKINEAAVPGDICHDVSWVTSLVGHQIHRFNYPGPVEARARNRKLNDGTQPMEPAVRISQIIVEPLLRDAAEESSHIELRYGWKFSGLEQDESSVTARIENSESGEQQQIRSEYLVGCDGGNSLVRQELGIKLSGAAKVRRRYSIHFRSDDKDTFEPWGPAWHYQSPVHGTLVNQDGKERYTLHSFLTEDEDDATVNPYDKVRPFVGKDFHFELLRANSWDNNLLVADSYRDGRVFLAGDSTHQYIPTGGYGMNTGVGDAFDLGWKLSAVINGWGGEGLLSAFEEERRPIGLKNCDEAKRHTETRLAIGKFWPENIDEAGPAGDKLRADLAAKISEIGNAENESLGVEIGYSYAGSSILCNEPGDEHSDDPLVYQPTTTPGYRPPAVYLDNGRAIYDLFGPEFTLLNLNPMHIDTHSFESAAKAQNVPLKTISLSGGHVKSIYQYNLVLIRPDHHVAWRGSKIPEPIDNMVEILNKVSGK